MKMMGIKNALTSYICIVSLVLLFGYSSATPKGTINFWLDYCTFKQPGKATNLVDLYYAVPFNNLTFIKAKNKFEATFQLQMSIYDEKDNLIINREWTQSFLVNTFAETRSAKEFIGKAILEFKPGIYKLVASISDRNSLGKAQTEKELVVEEFGKSPLELSDLKLSKQVNSSIIPNPKLIFEDDLYLAYEIYLNQKETIKSTDTIELEYSICEVSEQEVNISKQSRAKLEEIVKADEKFDLFDLSDGHYILIVNVKVDSFNASKERKFMVKKPTYNYSLGSNFSEDLRLLKYVATKKEIKELKKLKDASERASYLERFWKRRDPTPRTRKNELFEEFLRRLQFANKYFATPKKKGWQTDRGHVYILLGEPYTVRDLPFELGEKPRQIWTYARYGELIFEDEWQNGDYILVGGWELLPRKFVYK